MLTACIALLVTLCHILGSPCHCRRLDDDFRLQYARMWQALVMADEAGIRSAAAGMGAGETTELFAGVLTQRPWSQVRNAENSCESLNTRTLQHHAIVDTCYLCRSGAQVRKPSALPLQVVKQSSDHLRVGRGGEAERQELNE